MATMSDLSGDLVWDILSRVPLTSLKVVLSTCKKLNTLSKIHIFGTTKKQFKGFMLMNARVFSIIFDLQESGIDDDLFVSSITQVSIFNQVDISEVFHCDGVLLCVTEDPSKLVIWNPYLGETRWIEPEKNNCRVDMYALGYDSKQHNNKMLRFLNGFDGKDKSFCRFEIYDFYSSSWRVLDINPDWDIMDYQRGVTLKGNTYSFAKEKVNDTQTSKVGVFLLCFDFTAERFGQRLPLPFQSCFRYFETVNVSSVRDEQLAVLYQRSDRIIEIWITTKIDPNAVSWSKFLKVDKRLLTGCPDDFFAWSFFIDEEKKFAVVSQFREYIPSRTRSSYHTSYVIGDKYFRCVKIGAGRKPDIYGLFQPLVFSSYVPSLVQLKGNKEIIN